MAKDTGKYQYITIGLRRGSKTLERFLADAEEHHMPDQLGKFAAACLTDYFQLKDQLTERGVIVVGGLAVNTLPGEKKKEASHPRQGQVPAQDQRSSEEAIAPASTNASENADQTLRYFLNEEEL